MNFILLNILYDISNQWGWSSFTCSCYTRLQLFQLLCVLFCELICYSFCLPITYLNKDLKTSYLQSFIKFVKNYVQHLIVHVCSAFHKYPLSLWTINKVWNSHGLIMGSSYGAQVPLKTFRKDHFHYIILFRCYYRVSTK